jgi:hypothetical protein
MTLQRSRAKTRKKRRSLLKIIMIKHRTNNKIRVMRTLPKGKNNMHLLRRKRARKRRRIRSSKPRKRKSRSLR